MQESFPRTFSSLQRVFRFVGDFLTPKGVDEAELREVELVIEEIFTNLVKYNTGGKHEIPVQLERRGNKLLIVLTDRDVERFDVTSVPAVDTQQPMSKRQPGGLGWHLVREMSESVSYEYENRTSTITVVKPLESWNA
ncbi:MAG: ATP-binding protein [Candidatus Latescibacterota bacterium]|nr:MAG: ATP-binding protein [Candidatus Latescibacterota bacterium]